MKKIKKFFGDLGYRSIVCYRISSKLRDNNIYRLANLILTINNIFTGVEINPKAYIGRNVKFMHAKNIVIGGSSKIKDNCIIYNSVTLGVSGSLYKRDDGYIMQEAKYPTIKSNCIIYPGAKILGGITIGENCIIGANAVVIKDIPNDSIVGGIPGRVINKNKFDLKDLYRK